MGVKVLLLPVGVDYCNQLFAVEKKWAELMSEKREEKRQEEAKPLLDAFFVWLDTVSPEGGGKLSKAVAYARDLQNAEAAQRLPGRRTRPHLQ